MASHLTMDKHKIINADTEEWMNQLFISQTFTFDARRLDTVYFEHEKGIL